MTLPIEIINLIFNYVYQLQKQELNEEITNIKRIQKCSLFNGKWYLIIWDCFYDVKYYHGKGWFCYKCGDQFADFEPECKCKGVY